MKIAAYGYDHHDGDEEETAGETAAARHGLLDLVLTAVEQVFEVARRAATTSPATIAPRHGLVLSWLLQDTYQLLRVVY